MIRSTFPAVCLFSVLTASTVFTIQVYVDNALQFQQNGKSVDTYLSMGAGQHYLTQGGTRVTGFGKLGSVNVK